MRDATLHVAGRLSLRMGGPSFQDVRPVRASGTTAIIYLPADVNDEQLRRRTLYRMWSRGGRNRLLDAFDCPDPSTTAPSRAVTTTPLQALAMLNNAFVLHMSRHLAERIEREAGDDVDRQIRRAYLLAYGRPPQNDELKLARQVVAQARPGGAGAGHLQQQRISLRGLRADMTTDGWFDRRQFFSWVRNGLGSAALASLLVRDGIVGAAAPRSEAADPCPHFKPRARRAIHICLVGAMSHVDTFDYKPELIKSHGKSLKTRERPDVFFGQVGLLRKPDWQFKQRGASGLWVSELFPHLAEVADELTVIRSMYAETSNHTPATFQENSGFRLNGFPVLGAWLSYGLGSESDNLPAFVVIPDAREYPPGGSINWSNGFLPARHQGVVIRGKGDPIDDLSPALPDLPRRRPGHAGVCWNP